MYQTTRLYGVTTGKTAIVILAAMFVCFYRDSPQWARASSFRRFLDHTRHITFGRTPLDEWPIRRTDLYLTTHNTQNRQTSTPRIGIRTHNLSRRAAADLRLKTAQPLGPALTTMNETVKFRLYTMCGERTNTWCLL